jgi:hypothetical protein
LLAQLFASLSLGSKPRPTSLLKARNARLGNVPGYYRSSLAGLRCCRRGLVVFLDAVRRGHPAATPGCLLFYCAGAARDGSPQGFRAAGLHQGTGHTIVRIFRVTTNDFSQAGRPFDRLRAGSAVHTVGREKLPSPIYAIGGDENRPVLPPRLKPNIYDTYRRHKCLLHPVMAGNSGLLVPRYLRGVVACWDFKPGRVWL